MNSLEELVMEEISTLPYMQLIDVLGFIRFLKSETAEQPGQMEQWFDGALKSVHGRKVEFKLTEEDIQAELKKRLAPEKN